jgi:hypothetical protein
MDLPMARAPMTPLPPSPFLSAAGQSPRRSAAAEPATELRTHPAAPVAGRFSRDDYPPLLDEPLSLLITKPAPDLDRAIEMIAQTIRSAVA